MCKSACHWYMDYILTNVQTGLMPHAYSCTRICASYVRASGFCLMRAYFLREAGCIKKTSDVCVEENPWSLVNKVVAAQVPRKHQLPNGREDVSKGSKEL